MDLLEAKSKIAEALVESIFRRASYSVEPFRAAAAPLRFGREDFSPDFRARAADDTGGRDVLVEVKYRPSVEQFLSVENQRGERSVFLLAQRHWPSLYFVLVTDRPQVGRSCFQAIPLADLETGAAFRATDLEDLGDLHLVRNNIEDHEELVRRIFGLLSG
jgi:hypothetical protein